MAKNHRCIRRIRGDPLYCYFSTNRKTNARKEKATADSMVLQNLLSIIDNLNKQIERYDERLKQRDEKVDTIYREWRTSQADVRIGCANTTNLN